MKRYLVGVCLFFGMMWLVACGSEGTTGGGGDGPSEPVEEEGAPEISSFTATPSEGASLEVTFSWQIDNPNGDTLTCTFNFGDGSDVATVEDCPDSSAQTHTYQEEGSYTAELSVSDGGGEPVSRTTTVTVGGDDPVEPPPPNGGERPECTLESNNNSQDTACRLNIGGTYEGQLGTEEENDYYVFTTPQDSAGVAEVLLASIPTEQRLTFELLDANKNPIDSPFTSYTDGNPGEFFVLSPADTTYYLRVSNGSFGNTSNETYNRLVPQ